MAGTPNIADLDHVLAVFDADVMNDALKSAAPDEVFEASAALKLMLKGYASAALGGAIWSWPSASTVIEILATLASGMLVYISCLALVPASGVIRNIVGRKLGLRGCPRLAIAFGVAILRSLLVLAVVIFGLGRHIYADV
jgi:hypothetical protein